MKFRPWGWKVVAVAGVGSLASYLASSVPVLSEEKKCPETDARTAFAQRLLRNDLC